MNDFINLLEKCYIDYQSKLSKYKKMYNYYNEKHDIVYNYKKLENRANQVIVDNFIGHFIDLETNYTVSKPLNYISKTGNKEIIDIIENSFAHLSKNYDVELLRNVGIFGKCYEIYSINDNEFNTTIVTPLNGYLYKDRYDNSLFFMHIFKLQFDEKIYIDVYTDKEIIHFDNSFSEILERTKHYFGKVPVGECEITKTVFEKIKTQNDAMNNILSDNINMISDLRNAYLVFTGAKLDEKQAEDIKKLGIIMLPKNGKAEWLTTQIPDQHVINMVTTLRNDMYRLCGHVDLSEKLQSNTSGSALRNRLLALEQRCSELGNAIVNCAMSRLKFLFIYLSKLGKNYSYKDISIRYTVNIPIDLVSIGQFISQVGENLSLESKLALFSFVDNPQLEIEKIKAEKEEEMTELGNKLLEGASNDEA